MRIPPILAAAAVLAAAAPHAVAAQADSIGIAAPGKWSYTGPTGPGFWASPLGFRECAGRRQSPVDLRAWAQGDPLRVTVDYPALDSARLVNTGHTVDLILDTRATLRVADSTFVLREVHFHLPAEHLVRGERHAAELHAVHLSETGAVVLTTFVREARQDNRAWDQVIAHMPGNRGDTIRAAGIDLTALLALADIESEAMFSYDGSLTTPPCSPSVRFLIRRAVIGLSRPQIEALASAFARNARPVHQVTTPVILHRAVP